MIGVDFDGTVINWGRKFGEKPIFNDELLADITTLEDKDIWICTNQGGIAFGMRDQNKRDTEGELPGQKPRKYPIPEEFVNDVIIFSRYLTRFGLTLKGVSVSLYHPSVETLWIKRVVTRTKKLLYEAHIEANIYEHPRFRKPNPDMLLQIVTMTTFFGDGDEDRISARDANKVFFWVPKFTGEGKNVDAMELD